MHSIYRKILTISRFFIFVIRLIPENFKQAIRVVYYKLRKKNISWAFVGSTNMVLQGIPNICPKDLDIITHHKDLTLLEYIFRDHVTEPITKQPPI